jgi:hypothetical protein
MIIIQNMLRYTSPVGPLKHKLTGSKAEYVTTPDRLVLAQTMPPPELPLIGYLTQEHRSCMYGLHGRPTYTNRAVWEYNVNVDGLRLPLCTDPQRILMTGDTVEIPGQSGVYRVTIYEPRFSTD